MTFEEYMRLIEQINAISRRYQNMFGGYAPVLQEYQSQLNRIQKAFTLIRPATINVTTVVTREILKSMQPIYGYQEQIQKIFTTAYNFSPASAVSIQNEAAVQMDDDIVQALEGIEPILYNHAVPIENDTPFTLAMEAAKTQSPLKVTDIIALIALLFTIISFVLGLIPDDQLEHLSDQQDEIISQNKEFLQLEEEKLRLMEQHSETCHTLLHAVETLSNKIEPFTDQPDQITQLSDDEIQSLNSGDDLEHSETEHEDCDAIQTGYER